MGKMRRAGSMSRTAFSVSVAMAAYNGAPFIGNQIESILSQLKEGDEPVSYTHLTLPTILRV